MAPNGSNDSRSGLSHYGEQLRLNTGTMRVHHISCRLKIIPIKLHLPGKSRLIFWLKFCSIKQFKCCCWVNFRGGINSNNKHFLESSFHGLAEFCQTMAELHAWLITKFWTDKKILLVSQPVKKQIILACFNNQLSFTWLHNTSKWILHKLWKLLHFISSISMLMLCRLYVAVHFFGQNSFGFCFQYSRNTCSYICLQTSYTLNVSLIC